MLKSKRGFKAMAIACTAVMICASGQLFTNTNILNNTSYVYAETVQYTSEVNDDGCLVIHLTNGSTSSTVSLALTNGKAGYTTSGEVGYWDSSASKWVSAYYSWENQKFGTDGTLTISGIKVPTGVSDVQILVTYYADWSTGKEVKGDLSTLKISSVQSGGTSSGGSSSTTTTNQGGNTGGGSGSGSSTTLPANAECGWTDVTSTTSGSNSKNLISESVTGTKKTVTLTQGGQWSAGGIENGIILDQTYEAEKDASGNAIYDTDSDNETITNSNNFMFADAFGVPSDADIDHFRFTIESEQPMYQVQFGAGISVKNGSTMANSGSPDTSGNIKKIWFNESGTAPEEEGGDDYSSLENENGKSYYGYNSGKETYAGGTNYIQLQWNVYDDLKSEIQNDSWSSVSIQYWYGVDPADWDKVDWENNPVDDITHQPEQVKVTEASCTYNITKTYDYTDTVKSTDKITATVGDGMNGVKFSDLGLVEGDMPKAVTFKISGDSDIGKLVSAFGVSVNDEYTGEEATDNWYQTNDLVYEDCGSSYEVTWVIPEDIAKYISVEYDAEVKFGVWYAGLGGNALTSVSINEISVDYYHEEDTTTAPTVTTTTPTPTTVTPITDGIKGDVINLNMGPIDPADDDESSPTFHQFSIEPITQLLPSDYNPTTDDIAQIVFNISSPMEMKDITAACGIAVSLDCKDATDDYWYQGDDFKVSESGENVTITWTVPESIREYIQENQYGKVNLGIWYAGEGVDEVYLDSAYIVYTSNSEDGTTTTAPTVTTTSSNTTTTSGTTISDGTTTTSDTSSNNRWGDVNCDGKVNVADLVALRGYILHSVDVTEQGLINADVTHDDKKNVADLIKIRSYLLHTIEEEALSHA